MSQSGEPTSGIRFGNYEVVANDDGTPHLLGGGAYGKTYKAMHSFLGTTVALKVIHDSFAFDPGVKKRFLGEARAIAQLKHPHIAQVIDCGEDDGTLYYAMEYCDGGDLEKLVSSRGALSDETVLLLAKQAAKALAYVHDQKFLHRDLKPSNLMLSMVTGRDEANLKVIDFGLVKALGQENAVGMTQTGQFLGTLLYASPEQLREEELDERTDVFSLGLTLWFLLEGGLPLKGAPAQVVTQRLSGKGYDDLLPKESHEVVRKLLSQMMHPAREERLADMHAVLAGISDCLAQIHGTGQILLEGKGAKSGTMPQLAATGSASPRVQLVTSNQRMTSQFELGEEDKELQTDLGVRCRGRWIQRNEPVHLTIVRKAFAADVTVVHKLDQLVAKASASEGPFLIRPQALVQFVDQLVLAEEHVEGLSLLNVLRARRQLSLSDASPILRQIAAACDLAMKAGINTLELVAHRVLFQFPRNSVLAMTGGGADKLIMRPVSQWPQYLLRVAPAYTEAQRTGSSHMTNVRAPSLHGGATMVANADDDADSPSRFARLTYRVLSGHPVPVAAMMSQAAYVPIAGLSEEGNRLLAGIISRETPINDCLSLLQQIWRVESMPEAGLLLPMPAEQMTNLRQAASSEPPFVPPVQAPANAQDVVIIDPFTTAKRPTSAPPPAPRPQQPIAPPIISRQQSKARSTEPPPQPRPTSTPQVRPLGNVAPAQPQQPVRPATAPPPAEAPRARTQPPAPQAQPQTPARPPTQSPPVSQPEPWTRPPTSTPVRRGTQPPPEQQPELTAPPLIRADAPPPERKPLPTKLITIVAGGTVVLVGIILGVMQLMKPDPIQMAVERAQGVPKNLIEGLKPLLTDHTINLERLENEVVQLETRNQASSQDVFEALHRFYTNPEQPFREEDRSLIERYKQKNVEDAWDAFISNAEASKDVASLIDGHLHRATKSDSTTSRDWLVKQDIGVFKAATGEKLQTLIEQFRRSLASASPDEKKERLPKLATLMDHVAGAQTPESDWAVYTLFRDHSLATEAEAKVRLARAAQSGKEEYVSPWLAQLLPSEALQAHLKLASARPESLKELATRLGATTSAIEQRDILKVIAPLREKLPAELQPSVTRQIAEMEIADTKGITWTGKRDIYQKYNLNADAERVLEEAAKTGDEDAKMFIEDRKMRDHPEEQWRVYPERVVKGSTKPAQDALRWLLTQKDTDLIAHAEVVKPLLEKRLPTPGSKLEGNAETIVRKVGALRTSEWTTMPDGLYRLFQFYESYKLQSEAESTLKQAADKGIEPAMLELARRAVGTAAKFAAYLSCAEKKQSKAAIDWLLDNVKGGSIPPELQPRLQVVLGAQLEANKADKNRSAAVVASLVVLIDANKSLSPTDRTKKLRGYYAMAGMDEQLEQMDKQQLQSQFDAAKKSFVMADQRKASLTELHRLASTKIGPEVIQWLQANLEARAGNGNFQVLDPLDDATPQVISPADWKPSTAVALAKPVRYFKLPATLPTIVASKEGSVRPSSKAEGKITNPYTGKLMVVARSSWFPEAEVVDPDTDRKFHLPQDIELLVASFAEGKGELALKNPFDPSQSISLANWTSEKDWGRWKNKTLEMAVEGQPDHKFLLPDLDEVPALKRAVALDKCDLQKFALVSPFTGASIPFTVEQWRSGALVTDTSMKDLGLSASIALPEDRPVLEAKLTGKPFEVTDPYENQTVLVHWSQWKPGQSVTQLMSDDAKPSKNKGKSADKGVRFKLPADLGANADPQLEGTAPDRINHKIVSPYGSHKVEVGQKEWKPGGTIKDSEYAHLSIKLPTDLKGEWFVRGTAIAIEDSFSRVKSPYGDKPEVTVKKADWAAGEATDPKNDDLPFDLPKEPVVRTAKVTNPFKKTIKNPFTGDTDHWEGEWSGGAKSRWAGPLTIQLESPLPDTSPRSAKGGSLERVTNPWDGSSLSVTLDDWNNGRVSDGEGRPVLLGDPPSDPRRQVTLNKSSRRFTNPYTNREEEWQGDMRKGASMRWKKFTIVAEDVVDSINGVSSKMQRTFRINGPGIMMRWDPSGIWRSNPGAAIVDENLSNALDRWSSAAKGDGYIPRSFEIVHVGGGQLECRPKGGKK